MEAIELWTRERLIETILAGQVALGVIYVNTHAQSLEAVVTDIRD
jgi:hypothetical protein